MKYIILESSIGDTKQKIPIIFPNFLVHDEVAVTLANLLRRQGRTITHNKEKVAVLSAGEISMCDVRCFGRSETCKVSSDPADSRMIKMYDYFHGIE